MRHPFGIVGIILFLIGIIDAVLHAVHLFELIEHLIPHGMEPMFSLTGNFILILVGLFLMGLAWADHKREGHKHLNPTVSQPPQPLTPSSSVGSVSQVASPSITQNTYIDGHLAVPQKAEQSSRARLKSNLVCLGYKPGRVDFDGDESDVLTRKENGEFPAIFVNFRNNSKESEDVAILNYVRAHIFFKDSKGVELLDVSPGYWVSDSQQNDPETIDFPLDKTRTLLIAVRAHNNSWRAPWKESYDTGWGNATRNKEVLIPPAVEVVEISLTENTKKCLPTQRFTVTYMDDSNITLTPL